MSDFDDWAGKQVPEFNVFYAPVDDMPEEVQDFFRWFTNELNANRAPDIDGNLSYLFAYMYRAIWSFSESGDYELLAMKFGFLRQHYGHLKCRVHLDLWQQDAALIAKDWSSAWEHRQKTFAALVRNVTVNTHSRRLSADDMYQLADRSIPITPWGAKRKQKVYEAAEKLSDMFFDVEGKNFVDSFCERYEGKEASLTADEIAALADELDDGTKFAQIRRTLQETVDGSIHHRMPWVYTHFTFGGVPLPPREPFSVQISWEELRAGASIPDPPPRLKFKNAVMPGVSPLVIEYSKLQSRAIFREAENVVREAAGLPRVGAGWVSESEMFNSLVEAFPGTRVQQHARPEWLKPQHLDAWLPDHNIAIEYQGAQHDAPVELFGGEEGFKRTLARDAKKRKLCGANGCHLIEVRPGYDPEELIVEIRRVMTERVVPNP